MYRWGLATQPEDVVGGGGGFGQTRGVGEERGGGFAREDDGDEDGVELRRRVLAAADQLASVPEAERHGQEGKRLGKGIPEHGPDERLHGVACYYR